MLARFTKTLLNSRSIYTLTAKATYQASATNAAATQEIKSSITTPNFGATANQTTPNFIKQPSPTLFDATEPSNIKGPGPTLEGDLIDLTTTHRKP